MESEPLGTMVQSCYRSPSRNNAAGRTIQQKNSQLFQGLDGPQTEYNFEDFFFFKSNYLNAALYFSESHIINLRNICTRKSSGSLIYQPTYID